MINRYVSLGLVAVSMILVSSSCGKLKELSAFDVAYTLPRTTFTYQPTQLKSGEQLLYSGFFNANLDSILQANGFSSGLVGNTMVTSCSVTIQEPSNITFSWLQSARAEVSANENFTPAQPVGSVINQDPLNKTVVLTMNNTNIRPYLNGKAFYFRIFGVLNGAVPSEWVQMYVDGTLQMHLEPL
ncbi:MAG: hypothetical protein EOM90_14125 [Alphaproteobacteria bacterium]|nr:hypothetical protein [Alphaproteobacteria bacterium]